jgi:amino acid transporter
MSVTTHPKPSPGGVVKRLLVGRAFASDRMEHTLLPKVLALPVFASDALSSVSYATGEILLVLLTASAASRRYVMPISVAIAALMIVVVASYRQTVRAYPTGGGAYIVTKENLGTGFGLIAAAALLVDYLLTVVVSIVAGVFAIGSALPWANEHRVALSIFFVLFVTLLNLRGARESGTLFAIPTYGFILSILALIAVGLVVCAGGCPDTQHVTAVHGLASAAGPVGLFVILHAFSSGSTALTGVEAISDGVPAFRRPQAQNAATTLAIMGALGVTMFLGISFLATHIGGVTASEERSVVAQIAWAVFDQGGVGFYIVQAFTAGILILAANTAYQDFPRLSMILARDRYMPRQFMNRGDRLVFSNGVIGLGLLACLMIYGFQANLSKLIQLYVVGVFTSFTLSQTGMVLRWRRENLAGRAPRNWRRSMAINAVGAATTFVVLIVITYTKFADGAWISISAMALLVPILLSIHRHYLSVMDQLRRSTVRPGETGANHVVLLVSSLDAATAEAIGYARAIRPASFHAVWPSETGRVPADIRARWREFGVGNPPDLEGLAAPGGDTLRAVRGYLRRLPRESSDFVTVIVPELVRERLAFYLLRRRSLVRLKAGLLREPNVVVADAPVVVRGEAPVGVDLRPLIPERTVALVFVSAVHDATIRAVNYARSLGAAETRAIHFDLDPETAHAIVEQWAAGGLHVPLDIVEAPFRDLAAPMLDEIRRHTARRDTLCLVVIPELVASKWRHLLLHNQNALFVKRLLLYEPRVVLSSVPFLLEPSAPSRGTGALRPLADPQR